jgi:hypothetical protein
MITYQNKTLAITEDDITPNLLQLLLPSGKGESLFAIIAAAQDIGVSFSITGTSRKPLQKQAYTRKTVAEAVAHLQPGALFHTKDIFPGVNTSYSTNIKNILLNCGHAEIAENNGPGQGPILYRKL